MTKAQIKARRIIDEVKFLPEFRRILITSSAFAYVVKILTLCEEAEKVGILDSITVDLCKGYIPQRGRLSLTRLDNHIEELQLERKTNDFTLDDLPKGLMEIFLSEKNDKQITELLKRFNLVNHDD